MLEKLWETITQLNAKLIQPSSDKIVEWGPLQYVCQNVQCELFLELPAIHIVEKAMKVSG